MFDATTDPGPSLMRRFGELIRAPALTTPDAWAQASRVLGTETGLPGPRNPYLSPSMVPLGRAAVSGLYRRVVGVTGAQTGKTDTVLDGIGQRLDQRPTPILYVGPSAEFNRHQFEPRLRRMIDESAGLTSKLVRGRREKKTLKTVAGVRVRLASAASSTSFKSDPAGFAIADEYDEILRNIRGHPCARGNPATRGRERSTRCDQWRNSASQLGLPERSCNSRKEEHRMTDTIPARLIVLKSTPTPELKTLWRELLDSDPPPSNRRYL